MDGYRFEDNMIVVRGAYLCYAAAPLEFNTILVDLLPFDRTGRVDIWVRSPDQSIYPGTWAMAKRVL